MQDELAWTINSALVIDDQPLVGNLVASIGKGLGYDEIDQAADT